MPPSVLSHISRVCSILIALAAALLVVSPAPALGSSDSSNLFSTSRILSSIDTEFRLAPRVTASFLQAGETPPSADLTVNKSASADTAQPGSNITYTITVSNLGPDEAANATLTDALAAGTTFVSLDAPGGWSCSTPNPGDHGTVTCSIQNLPVTNGEIFTLVVNIPAETSSGTFLTNVATVTTETLDSNDENNSSTANTLIPGQSADVGVFKTASSETTRPDSDVTYTIEVRNGGPNDADNVGMTDTLPGDMTLVSFTQTSGPTFTCSTPATGAGGTVTCSVATLAAGASGVFKLVGHVPAGEPAGTGYDNTAIVTSATQDPNDENNSSTASTSVVTCDTNSTVSSNADSGAGSLRQVVADACPGSTVTFSPLLTGPITLTSGPIVVDKALKIQGPGWAALAVRHSTAAEVAPAPVFLVQSGASVEISGLTISDGKSLARGGGILNNGTLTLASVVISNNTAFGGGGIHNEGGTLTIKNSVISVNTATNDSAGGGGGLSTALGTVNLINVTFKNNVAGDEGGAIYNNDATLNIINSLFNQNESRTGAAIFNDASTLARLTTIINTTISGNTGNGITNGSGTVKIINSTITNNTANNTTPGGGGAVNVSGAVFNVGNTIIAGNNAATSSRDVLGNFNSLGNNLVGVADGSTGFKNGVSGDLAGTFASPLNARLGPLVDNGGTTPTHALLAGSPALDAGNNSLLPADTFDLDGDDDTSEALPVDQRTGFMRVADASDADLVRTVDIGAFEAQVSVEDITDKTTAEDTPLTFVFNVGDPLLVTGVTVTSSDASLVPNDAAHLSITGSGGTRQIQITPTPNSSGATLITVTVTGAYGQAMTDTFAVTVTPVNDAPLAANDSYTTAENTALSVAAPGVLLNDSDVDSATLTALVVTNPTNGSLTLNANGSFVYTPNQGFVGTDSFSYKANDGAADSNIATVSITVTEGGTLQLSSATYSVAEDAGLASVTVTRASGSAGTATVLLSTSNGTATAGSDYTSVSQTVTFNNGEITKTVSIPITDDATDEADETVNITLSNAGGSAQLGSPTTAVLTILDNDAAPSISINDVSSTEGNSGTKSFNFTVTLSAASAKSITVDYATADGTATGGSDYQTASGTLTFAPGETSKQVAVNIVGDSQSEPDETFFVNLTNATNATIADAQGTGTITNDDTAPTLSINDVSDTEGNSGTKTFTFTVTLSAASGQTVTVDFATANGTATAGTDYQATNGTLTFNPGDLQKTVTVTVNGDTANEANETFFVNLSNAVNANITDNQGLGTIQNDDAPGVQFSSNSYSFSEGAGHGDITVTRTGDTSAAMTVDYQTSDQSGMTPCQTLNTGIASDRCDYATAAGTLRFAAGETQQTIRLVLIDDVYVEGPEQLSIRLINPSGASLGSVDTATVTITDNDSDVNAANPIDNLDFFIRQLYIDFLGREPDAAGFQFWKQRMTTNCPAGQTCDRIDTALRFFGSDEFRERGYFVYVFYHAALGRRPTYAEWILDVAKLNGFQTVAEQQASRDAFINEFMSRQEFMNLYNQFQTGDAFVNALIQKSGVTPASKQSLIDNYATVGRAATLKAFMETPEVQAAFVDRAFVTMLYFGFLRRDAEAGGFDFWMQKLNQTNHDYRFITGGFLQSDEYRFRFGRR